MCNEWVFSGTFVCAGTTRLRIRLNLAHENRPRFNDLGLGGAGVLYGTLSATGFLMVSGRHL